MTSLADESFLTATEWASGPLQVAKQQLSHLAALGRVHEIRAAARAGSLDPKDVDAAILAAANNGRPTVLSFFAEEGVDLEADRLLRLAAVAGHRNIFHFFHQRGAVVYSPELATLAMCSDRAAILRFWLDNKFVEASELLSDAARFNAFNCFHVLANSPDIQTGPEYAAFLRTTALPERLYYIVGGRRPPAIYTWRMPSELIDIDRASLHFLVYRRILRLVTMGRLRR